MAKLTLNVDSKLIEAAKDHARRRRTSVSKLVSGFLRSLGGEPRDEFFARLHAELEARGFRQAPPDLDRLRKRHLLRKHS